MAETRIRAYECTVPGSERPTIVNARSRGAAHYEYWLEVSDCCPDLPFTAVRVVLHGKGEPVTTDMHRRVIDYRGRPELVAGRRVTVRSGGPVKSGTVVGAGDGGALIKIQIDGEKYPGYVHPADVFCEEVPNV